MASVVAQAPPPAPVLPPPDDLDAGWIQAVTMAQRWANESCQGLDAVKEYTTLRLQVTAKLEARHPGLTLNWTTGAFIAKK